MIPRPNQSAPHCRIAGARDPGREPAADVAAAGNRRQIIELRQQRRLVRHGLLVALLVRAWLARVHRERLDDAKCKRCAADTTAREAKRGRVALVQGPIKRRAGSIGRDVPHDRSVRQLFAGVNGVGFRAQHRIGIERRHEPLPALSNAPVSIQKRLSSTRATNRNRPLTTTGLAKRMPMWLTWSLSRAGPSHYSPHPLKEIPMSL